MVDKAKDCYSFEKHYGQDNTIEVVPLTKGLDNSVTDLEGLNKITDNVIIYSYKYKMSAESTTKGKQWINFDLTSSIVNALNNPEDYNGYCIRNAWEFTGQGGRPDWAGGTSTFISSDNTEHIDKRPKLILVLTYDDYVVIDDNNNVDKAAYQFHPYTISWTTNSDAPFKIELLKDGSVVETIAENLTENTFTWDVPLSSPSGSNFKLKISNDKCSFVTEDYLTINKNKPIKSFPYEMTFDSLGKRPDFFKYNWNHMTEFRSISSDFNFKSLTGKTPSRKKADKKMYWKRPGPTEGHNGTSYVYTEGDANNNKLATLYSPLFDLTTIKTATLQFWYHLNTINGSADVGDLYLDINVDGNWIEGIFHKGGNQGDKWNLAKIDLSPYEGKIVQFAFRAKHKDSELCDIGLDDFSITGTSTNNITKINKTNDENISFSINDKNIAINKYISEETKVSLVSVSGRVILTRDFSEQLLEIDLQNSKISKGLYILVFEFKDQPNKNYPVFIK